MNGEPVRPEKAEERLELQGLRMLAPEGALLRFRRRARLVQSGKMLMESQVMGFWVVLDTLLQRLLGSREPLVAVAINNQRDLEQDGTGERV